MTMQTVKRRITKEVRDRETVRTTVIGVRVSYAEDDWITKRARELGLSRPDVCREALVHYMRSVTRNEQAAERKIDEMAAQGG